MSLVLTKKDLIQKLRDDGWNELLKNFYPEDFSQQEKERLPYELKHYELDVCKHPDLRKISTLSDLCKSLVECGKLVMYPLVDRLIRLILTLPVSTASS
ncbi:hypothetical protein PVK06_001805 [Gossypium arboreum]|uniref:Uncharacterized protein n=1 Tax=Gossypium arboreum TaxID=29729 RepID=A0ABR0R264_GOSAR|nr:hypothetical protein PVK06_001805 [Gossypium arboreum]